MQTPFKFLLLLAKGLSLLAGATGASATAFDSLGADMHGGQHRELQAFVATVESDDPSVCGTECQSDLAYNRIDTMVMAYDNLTPSAGTTGAATFPQVVDTYTGTCPAGYEPCAGDPFYMVYDAFLPQLIGAVPVQYGLSPIAHIRRWDFTTAPNGKITDGWVIHELLGGFSYTIFVDFTNRTFCTMSGGTAFDVDINLLRASGCNATGAAPLTWDSTHNFAYITCDITKECGQFSKSVPVPAFASTVLAFGLFGITALTVRRR